MKIKKNWGIPYLLKSRSKQQSTMKYIELENVSLDPPPKTDQTHDWDVNDEAQTTRIKLTSKLLTKTTRVTQRRAYRCQLPSMTDARYDKHLIVN